MPHCHPSDSIEIWIERLDLNLGESHGDNDYAYMLVHIQQHSTIQWDILLSKICIMVSVKLSKMWIMLQANPRDWRISLDWYVTELTVG